MVDLLSGAFSAARLEVVGEVLVAVAVLAGRDLIDHIDPDPEKIRMGMQVEVIYQIAPRKDRDGNEYLTYYFQPRS